MHSAPNLVSAKVFYFGPRICSFRFMTFSRFIGTLALIFAFQLSVPSVAAADEVLDWNTIAIRATRVAPPVPGYLTGRILAIVHVSMFDALQGLEHRYEPIHFDKAGPLRASRRAAVVQAAYRSLVTLFPAQEAAFNTELATSLETIAVTESAERIQRGQDWGNEVAIAVLAWRAGDNPPPPPPYLGSEEVGKWRPTPPGFLPGGAPLLGTTVPFVLPTASFFRPDGPPALASLEYARDFNQVKRVGESDSVYRTADQTESAQFWAGTSPGAIWNRAAQSASLRRNLSLSQNARLFVLLNIAGADAAFAAWDAKYYFSNWRPTTAIQLADTDGNPLTTADPDWVPLITTPNYPDYVSGHQSGSRSAEVVLTHFFGNRMGFEAFSEGLPGVVRSWRNFDAAADEANMSRVWAGIHFWFAQTGARITAEKVARYVLEHAAQPLD